MNAYWHALRREAEDPSTSAHRLAELALQDPSLWELIVRNPSCDPSYREWIFAQRPDLSLAAAAPAAVPAVLQPEPTLPAAPTRTRRGPLMLLTALGALALVLALAGVGTLWWITSDEKPWGQSPVAVDRDRLPAGRDNAEGASDETDPGADAGAEAATDQEGQTETETHTETATEGGTETETVAGDDDDVLLISSPSQNIACELGGSYVGCSIAERSAETDCSGERVASFLIYDGTFPMPMCGIEYLGTPGDPVVSLGYGESVTVVNTTCLSEPTGMTCWDTETGHGMTLSRDDVTLF
ncbi:hypothetical protein GCM10023160_33610 [Brachybacterium paraconglomeratum]|uniref:variant leucine-rich repeat-containing protein n=1 Tax=Brachybacterium paraconglomeratum TaxID=173362 RepID=UPI0031E64704